MHKNIIRLYKSIKIPVFAYYTVISLFFIVSLLYSIRSYNDYTYGKFDLGNMNQMLFNSSRGDFMRITDEFGGDASRFSMSHVDPSLLIFIPIAWFYSDAIFLVIITCFIFYIASILIYLISKKEGLGSVASSLNGLLIYLLPITGFVIIWTSFHPLLLGIPSLLYIYYLFLKNQDKKFNKKTLFLLIIVFLVFLLSKEELGFVFLSLSFYLYKRFPKNSRIVVILALIGFLWSLISFLVIIPSYSIQRTNDLNSFLSYANFENPQKYSTLASDNFFIHRYAHLGKDYKEISINLLKNPILIYKTLFNKDMLTTYLYLFIPTLFTVILTPLFSISLLPELLIHGLSGDSDIFNIENHRMAILIPLILVSGILFQKRFAKKSPIIPILISLAFCVSALATSLYIKNPLISPLFSKFFSLKSIVGASSTVKNPEWNYNLDPACADFILKDLDPRAKVSVPQVLGAKTSNRQYNAIFPTGLDKADIVIIDVLERKISNFLQKDIQINYDLTEKMLSEGKYKLTKSCNRLLSLSKEEGGNNNFEYSYTNIIDPGTPYQEFFYRDQSFFKFYTFESSQEGNRLNFIYSYIYSYEGRRHEVFPYTIISNGSLQWSFVHFPAFFTNTINKGAGKNDLITERFSLEIPDNLERGDNYEVYFGMGTSFWTKNNIKIGTTTIN